MVSRASSIHNNSQQWANISQTPLSLASSPAGGALFFLIPLPTCPLDDTYSSSPFFPDSSPTPTFKSLCSNAIPLPWLSQTIQMLFTEGTYRGLPPWTALCMHPQSCLTLWSPPGSSVHGFPRQEHWSGLPFPSPQDLPNPGIEPASAALADRAFTPAPPAKPLEGFILGYFCDFTSTSENS